MGLSRTKIFHGWSSVFDVLRIIYSLFDEDFSSLVIINYRMRNDLSFVNTRQQQHRDLNFQTNRVLINDMLV